MVSIGKAERTLNFECCLSEVQHLTPGITPAQST